MNANEVFTIQDAERDVHEAELKLTKAIRDTFPEGSKVFFQLRKNFAQATVLDVFDDGSINIDVNGKERIAHYSELIRA